MKNLALCNLESIDELACPKDKNVNLNSSALTIFTDFEAVQPIVLDASTSAVEAEKLMINSHVRLIIIVEQSHFLGVVSLDDLNLQGIIKREASGIPRAELCVADFMQARNELKAFSYEELQKSSINDVVETLQKRGQQHCIVVDRDSHMIRGIISASDIARKLRIPININVDSSFVNIFNALYHSAA
ncbi:CBS domain-containing protein [Colwellia echini]|uniref:CBS domain-containing protein n=1 Tax=Colwellia echini TaxID=1982103 RepID=A0ABY3N1I9_9GAMM|nr:CBS domain-containing protein [Colwellia echini]TYK67122.1 CBS domain-containing protein [Colwellia echini]